MLESDILNDEKPCLYVVATPIGNLDDITFRAVKALRSANLILAEDTRHSRVLLQHFGLNTPSEAYHDFNKEKKTPVYLEYLQKGNSIAMICDAGTPGIADPAYNLIRAAKEAGIRVIPIPGPCALIAALVCSGLPTDHFSFENFPPKKSAQRLRLLETLKLRYPEGQAHAPTLTFYVSPHQIVNFLGEIQTVFGDEMYLVLARELTKKFEEFLNGKPSELLLYYKERTPRGEYVLLFHPQNKR